MNILVNNCCYVAKTIAVACATVPRISTHSNQKDFTQLVKSWFQCFQNCKAVLFYTRNLPKRGYKSWISQHPHTRLHNHPFSSSSSFIWLKNLDFLFPL